MLASERNNDLTPVAAVASPFDGKRLLWIDDRVSGHRALINRMESHGIEITAHETFDDGLTELSNNRYDQVLLDAMLGHESSLPRIPDLLKVGNGAKISICSGFMYQDELKQQRKSVEEESGILVGTVEKAALPDFEEPEEVKYFLDKLFHKESLDIGKKSVNTDATKTSINLSYSDYNKLGLEAKMNWLDKVGQVISKEIEAHIEAGYVFLLFCGSAEKPVMQVDKYSDIPSEKEIMSVARKRGFAPFVVHSLGIIDDIPAYCCDSSGLRSYPTISASVSEGDIEEIHFDNGASHSLMSYEWYGEKGWISHMRNPVLIKAGEMTLHGARLNIDPCTFIDCKNSSIKANFFAYYIVNWENCRLAVQCGPGCQNSWSENYRDYDTCKFRTGLLGRTLPRDELKVRFITDFGSAEIEFLEG